MILSVLFSERVSKMYVHVRMRDGDESVIVY
jgi:hypothetical protein